MIKVSEITTQGIQTAQIKKEIYSISVSLAICLIGVLFSKGLESLQAEKYGLTELYIYTTIFFKVYYSKKNQITETELFLDKINRVNLLRKTTQKSRIESKVKLDQMIQNSEKNQEKMLIITGSEETDQVNAFAEHTWLDLYSKASQKYHIFRKSIDSLEKMGAFLDTQSLNSYDVIVIGAHGNSLGLELNIECMLQINCLISEKLLKKIGELTKRNGMIIFDSCSIAQNKTRNIASICSENSKAFVYACTDKVKSSEVLYNMEAPSLPPVDFGPNKVSCQYFEGNLIQTRCNGKVLELPC